MYKRGTANLSERQRRQHKGDWWYKIRLGEGRYKPIRLCADLAVSDSWAKAIQGAVLKRQADEAINWDQLKTLGIPRRLLEQAGIVSERAEARRKAWSEHVADY